MFGATRRCAATGAEIARRQAPTKEQTLRERSSRVVRRSTAPRCASSSHAPAMMTGICLTRSTPRNTSNPDNSGDTTSGTARSSAPQRSRSASITNTRPRTPPPLDVRSPRRVANSLATAYFLALPYRTPAATGCAVCFARLILLNGVGGQSRATPFFWTSPQGARIDG